MTTGDERMKTLFVLLGSTGIGKTDLCLSIADLLCCPIVNADSRQIYRELPIGTAAPTSEQQEHTRHYFVGTHSLTQNYSAAQYGEDARQLLSRLFRQHDQLLLSGGSMLYIDTVCHGIDSLPTVDETTRQLMKMRLESEGLPKLVEELKQLDPVWAERVDIHNPRRVIHALEICHITGQPYSSLIGRHKEKLPYRIIKIGLTRPREELYERINQRVELMMKQGLEDEARRALPFRQQNALNTVGYKELFTYFDGQCTLEEAIEKIKSNTRAYARKQNTWFNHDGSIVWFNAEKKKEILAFVSDMIKA